MIKFVRDMPWGLAVGFALTLGLAPFAPPHVWEKLLMLFSGALTRPPIRLIDWFDLVLHGAPWVVLLMKGYYTARKQWGWQQKEA